MSRGWMFPVSGYDEKSITSNFGERAAPVSGASTFHEGIDIAAPSGTTVIAALGGYVSGVSRSKARGNYVTVSSGDTVTEYAHLSEVNVKAGEAVTQGSKIGTVGSTGISTGPHLDFRIKFKGKYVDPLNFKYSGNYNQKKWKNQNFFEDLNGNELLEFVKQRWLWIIAGLLVFAILTKKR